MTRRLVPLLALLLLLAALVGGPAATAAEAPTPTEQAQELLTGGDGEGGDAEQAEDGGGEGEEEALPEDSPLAVELPEFVGDPLSGRAWKRYARDLLRSFAIQLPDLVVALLRALLVLLVFWLLYRLLDRIVAGFVRRTNADPSVLGFAHRLIKYVLMGFAVIMAASQLGFNVGSVLAGVGILGLALGLAAQESLSNLVAGLTLMWERPYRVGDNVTIAGTFGRVEEIGLRTTRILTVEHLDTILPNREIINSKIVNHTSNPRLRLDVPLSIAYREDIAEARRVLLAAVEGHEMIRDDPPPEVVVTRLADSGVEMHLRVWLRDPYRERAATFAFTELAKTALDGAGIEIPFPQRTLHFGSGTFPLAVEERRRQGGAGSREEEGPAAEPTDRPGDDGAGSGG